MDSPWAGVRTLFCLRAPRHLLLPRQKRVSRWGPPLPTALRTDSSVQNYTYGSCRKWRAMSLHHPFRTPTSSARGGRGRPLIATRWKGCAGSSAERTPCDDRHVFSIESDWPGANDGVSDRFRRRAFFSPMTVAGRQHAEGRCRATASGRLNYVASGAPALCGIGEGTPQLFPVPLAFAENWTHPRTAPLWKARTEPAFLEAGGKAAGAED
jgi:hypothetical protein